MTAGSDGAPSRGVRWDFSDQVVLVTGAARGQGLAHATAFARAGADVAICDIAAPVEEVDYPLSDPEALEQAAEDLRGLGARCLSYAVDVRDEPAVGHMVDDIVARLGRLDVLVNNAGVNAIHDPVDMPMDVWRTLLDTDLSGVYHCSRHAARVMRGQGGGRIVSTGSVNATLTMPWNAAYTAAKHGVAGLTKALAVDLARDGIRVNMVAPGLVETTLLACAQAPHVPEDYFDRLLKVGGQVSLFGDEPAGLDPEEISEAVLWLASDSARYVTGATVNVDAGFSIT
jgi:NAD(P)-dependent dehydrogenase (short-subunit alcohol dehydrogenase family)